MNQQRINQITCLLLVVGFGGALVAYLNADHTPINSLLNDPLAQKRHLRELRMMGGKANVLSAEITDWLEGRWQGESLAWTIAVLSVGLALTFRFIALRRSGSAASPETNENRPPDSV